MAARCTTPAAAMHHFGGMGAPVQRWLCTIICGQVALFERRTQNGFLIPVRDRDGLIQGLKIRLDEADQPNRKYRWLSSRGRSMSNGTRSYSWIHVTGDRTRKRAFLTEGP